MTFTDLVVEELTKTHGLSEKEAKGDIWKDRR